LFHLLNSTGTKNEIAKPGVIQQDDVAPGGNKATLTLANGSKIILDSTHNGALTEQGGINVVKLNGQLAYKPGGNKTVELLYNTVTTPKGGQYQLLLADGSRVWLNAASSLRFPTAFIGNERKVELTGEGYFEVAKNASVPFKVNIAGKCEVEVLGTHFNINAYADEATVNTTLLEGKVKVTAVTQLQPATHKAQILSPGQQTLLYSSGMIKLNTNVNVEEVMAWRNGVFNFDGADIDVVLRQLARWYDVSIVFEGEVPRRNFAGEMQRDLNLSQVLRILEKNNVRFRIEGKKLIVLK